MICDMFIMIWYDMIWYVDMFIGLGIRNWWGENGYFIKFRYYHIVFKTDLVSQYYATTKSACDWFHPLINTQSIIVLCIMGEFAFTQEVSIYLTMLSRNVSIESIWYGRYRIGLSSILLETGDTQCRNV